MNEKNNGGGAAGGGIGFCGALTIVFIVLKLLGKISWSWVWVLSPLWISFIIGCIPFFVVLIAALIDAFKD